MSSPLFIFILGFKVKIIPSSFSCLILSFLLTFHIAIPFQLPYCQISFLIVGISIVNIFSKTLHYSIYLDSRSCFKKAFSSAIYFSTIIRYTVKLYWIQYSCFKDVHASWLCQGKPRTWQIYFIVNIELFFSPRFLNFFATRFDSVLKYSLIVFGLWNSKKIILVYRRFKRLIDCLALSLGSWTEIF